MVKQILFESESGMTYLSFSPSPNGGVYIEVGSEGKMYFNFILDSVDDLLEVIKFIKANN